MAAATKTAKQRSEPAQGHASFWIRLRAAAGLLLKRHASDDDVEHAASVLLFCFARTLAACATTNPG